MTGRSIARETERAQARWMRTLRREGGVWLTLAVAAPVAAGLLLVAQAWVLARVLDHAIVGKVTLPALWPLIASLAGLLLIRFALLFVGELAAASAAERIKLALRRVLFERMLTQRPQGARAKSSGAVASAIVDQVEALDGFYARFLPATVAAGFLPIAFAAAVMPVDWIVGLLFLCTAPMIPVFMALVGWGAQAASNAQATAFSRLSGYFADRLRGLVTLTLLGRAEAEAVEAERATEELRRRTLAVLRIAFLSSAVLEFFAALGVAGVALYVGLTFLGMVDLRFSILTLQGGLFCLLMAPEVYQPLRTMAAHYHDRASAKAAVAEIAAQFGDLPDMGTAQGVNLSAPAARLGEGIEVEVRDLTVATPDGAHLVLSDCAYGLASGGHVALLGPSGSGKTTFIEALTGLRDANGEIRISGVDLADWSDDALRETVAYVPQRPHLFAGTIAENIRFGRANASDDDVCAAAIRARVADFTGRLPNGLGTEIGENGLGLSGGERHRVALARLYLRDPGLVLLDEPTAHLDAETAGRVMDGLLDFARGRTMMIATHSISVAERMGGIVQIRDKRLIAKTRETSRDRPHMEDAA